MRLGTAISVGLCVAIAAVYLQVRHHEFVGYDDIPMVIPAPGTCVGLSTAAVVGAFTEPNISSWVPLTGLSHQINCSLHGPVAAGYLLTNVALHAASSVLLFVLLFRMTGRTWPAAFVAGVFALHPLHVESVAWAAERRDVLCGVFWMLSLLAYERYARTHRVVWYAAVASCLLLSLLSKPMAVTLPFVLLLLDFWPLGRLRSDPTSLRLSGRLVGRAIVEKLPLFALVGIVAALTLQVQAAAGNLTYGSALPRSELLLNIVVSYGTYIVQSFWPADLAVLYPFPTGGPSPWLVGFHSVLLVAISLGALLGARTHPYLLVGWLWYLGTLVPVIGFVHVGLQSHADRYTYLPQIGLAIAFAWGIAEMVAPVLRHRLAAAGVGTAAVLALAGLGFAAWLQVHHWRDSIALFRRAVDVTVDNPLAHYNLGSALGQAGHIEEGLAEHRESERIDARVMQARKAAAQ